MKVLKKSDGDLKVDWEHEARRLAQLEGHRNVVRILGADSIVEGGRMAFRIVTEYIPKGPLSRHLSNGFFSSKPWLFKLQVARGVCECLRYNHVRGIIHIDLKSDNILLGEGNLPKIADFGLARYRPHSFPSREYRGPVGGDARYISPECCVTNEDTLHALGEAQTAGAGAGYDRAAFVKALLARVEGRITKASDMFSLGIVLWEIAAGRVTGLRSDADIQRGAFYGDVRASKVQFFNPAITGCVKASATDRISIDRAATLFDGQDTEARRLDAEPGCVVM